MFDYIKANQDLVQTILAIVFSVSLLILSILAYKYESRTKGNGEKIKKMVTLSILAAISVVLYLFVKFPMNWILPFIPGFLDVQFSSLPVYIGGFMFGPISGTLITIIRFLVKLPNTQTAGVGELADFIIGFASVLVSSMIYHHHKTKRGAIIALISIVVSWTVTAIIINWTFILEFYMNFFGFDAIFGMLTTIPGITADNYMTYYILIAVIPFNLILSSLVSIITYIVYKRLSMIYRDIHINKG
ncbi:MAG: ECF transporter S component [Acholeplasma sp.]|jgi:riboflavin transporter FmnP|nr:MAG: ECF transporter S component [Acholeplasma sp.]